MGSKRPPSRELLRTGLRLGAIFAATQVALLLVTRHSALPAFTPLVEVPFNVRWWLALTTLMSREGLLGAWTPYPPVFPTLHLGLYEMLGFDAEILWRHFFLGDPGVRSEAAALVRRAGLLWAGMNAILLVTLALLVSRLATRVRGAGAGLLAGGAFLLMSQSYASRMLLGLSNDQFDYLPCVLLLLGLHAILQDAPITAGVAAAVGALTKLFPVVLVPVALLRLGGVRARAQHVGAFALAFALVGAAIAAPFAFGGEHPLSSWARYTSGRSGWESVWIFPHKALPPWPPSSAMRGLFDVPYVAQGVPATSADHALLVATLVALGALLLFARPRLASAPAFVRAVLVAILALLFFAKGFSSYYVQWFLPLLFVVYRAEVAALWFAAFLVAANLELVGPLPELPWFWPSIFLRHALLVALAAEQLWRLWLAPRVVEAPA